MVLTNAAGWHIGKLLTVNPESSCHKEKMLSFLLYLYETMSVSWTHCGHYFMMQVSCIVMLYALNIYSSACQSFLTKTGGGAGVIDKWWYKDSVFCFRFYPNIVWCIFILRRGVCVCVCVFVFKSRGNFVRSFSSVSTALASVETQATSCRKKQTSEVHPCL